MGDRSLLMPPCWVTGVSYIHVTLILILWSSIRNKSRGKTASNKVFVMKTLPRVQDR